MGRLPETRRIPPRLQASIGPRWAPGSSLRRLQMRTEILLAAESLCFRKERPLCSKATDRDAGVVGEMRMRMMEMWMIHWAAQHAPDEGGRIEVAAVQLSV